MKHAYIGRADDGRISLFWADDDSQQTRDLVAMMRGLGHHVVRRTLMEAIREVQGEAKN